MTLQTSGSITAADINVELGYPSTSVISMNDARVRELANKIGFDFKHTLDNPNTYGTSANDYFGFSVAIDGDYAIVGAHQEDDTGGTNSGKAYIFNVTTNALVHTLNNPNAYGTSAFDSFGDSVAISGNYAIVGATGEDDVGGSFSGKAYIFNVTTGALVHTLNNPNAYGISDSDYFGSSVAISGNYAIVGAYGEDDVGGSFSGKAYIFDVTTGALVHTLNNPNAYGTSGGDSFGSSVAISGNYAIVGAYSEDDAEPFSGKAYIYNVTTGALVHTLNTPNEGAGGDQFGISVGISGNYAIVGAWGEDGSTGQNSGAAYIFNVSIGALVHTLNNPNTYGGETDDLFGRSVAISGDRAIVGAYGEGYNPDFVGAAPPGTSSGIAYVFSVTTGELLYTLDNPNMYLTSEDDFFGYSVAISSDRAIVGAYGEDDSSGYLSGKAYIYGPPAISFSDFYGKSIVSLKYTLNNPNAYGTSETDKFGIPVAIDGNYAIVSAYQEDDAVGNQSGKAYIFNVTTGALVHTLDNPNAYGSATNDFFGISVAISGDWAIVGAWFEGDAGGFSSGKAYIFNVTTGVLVHTLNNPTAYGTSGGDSFGRAVAISGDRAIVGAYQEDYSGGNDSGIAYIFNVTTGALVHTLNNPNAYGSPAFDYFGWAVAISGDRAIVGAYQEDGANGQQSGKAYIFNVTTGALVSTLNNPSAAGENDYFGSLVAIDGNYAIVGAYQDDDVTADNSGKAHIFNVSTGALVHTLNNPNASGSTFGDYFGSSISISGNYAVVGASNEDFNGSASGSAYVFNVTSGALVSTLNNPNAYGAHAGDQFGSSVAISDDRIIISAFVEDDAGGVDSGKAYIYKFI